MLNWGLVGCGDISYKRIAPAITCQPESNLLAIMDINEERVDAFAERFNIKRKYLELNSMLENKNIDAIYVATPVYLHYEIALEAIKNKKHVLVEKPMAITNLQCEELIAEAKKHNVNLGIAYYRRFFPKMREIKRVINERIIGDIIQIRINYNSWYNPVESGKKAWRIDKVKAGGGPLWDIGCHKLDMLIDLIGMPKSVLAKMDILTHKYEVEDSCSAIIEMENGAPCLASFNWNSKIWADEFEILGTDGKIVLNPCDSEYIELQLNPKRINGLGKEITKVAINNHSNVHYPLIADFVKAVLEGNQPLVNGEEGYKTNKLLEAIEISSSRGKKVFIQK